MALIFPPAFYLYPATRVLSPPLASAPCVANHIAIHFAPSATFPQLVSFWLFADFPSYRIQDLAVCMCAGALESTVEKLQAMLSIEHDKVLKE